ncbi:DUF2922 domain-containing protein [Bacillaceae bacterium Marseille-Q3522]|nr:DUF2922 domain-containing protein [Bacillaceae bacterium Marseille-Q3522]
MAKTLELHFFTSNGQTAKLNLDEPKEPIDLVQVKTAMDQIIASNAFISKTGPFTAAKEARVIERNVTEYPIEA